MALNRRIQLIDSAKREIQVQVFTLRQEPFSQRLLKLLAAKARHGVSVRLLTDGLYGRLSAPLRRELEASGVKLSVSRRMHVLLPWKNLQRMHDKLIIVDREHVLTGGRKLEESFELEIILGGLAAEIAASYFDQCWQEAYYAPGFGFSVRRRNFIFLGGRDPARELYKTLSSAEKEIILCSPHFTPSGKLARVLLEARKRGLRVRSFTSQHAKCVIVDGTWVYIGSFNFDPGSVNLNSESLFGIQDAGLCKEVLCALESFAGGSGKPKPRLPVLTFALRPMATLSFIRSQF